MGGQRVSRKGERWWARQGTKTDTWDKAGPAEGPQLLSEGPTLPTLTLPYSVSVILPGPGPALPVSHCRHLSHASSSAHVRACLLQWETDPLLTAVGSHYLSKEAHILRQVQFCGAQVRVVGSTATPVIPPTWPLHSQQDLLRVLKAYTLYRPEEGYCQAQAPVAAVLLMHMPAEVPPAPGGRTGGQVGQWVGAPGSKTLPLSYPQQAFWCLVQICEKYLPGYYSEKLVSACRPGTCPRPDVVCGLSRSFFHSYSCPSSRPSQSPVAFASRPKACRGQVSRLSVMGSTRAFISASSHLAAWWDHSSSRAPSSCLVLGIGLNSACSFPSAFSLWGAFLDPDR